MSEQITKSNHLQFNLKLKEKDFDLIRKLIDETYGDQVTLTSGIRMMLLKIAKSELK